MQPQIKALFKPKGMLVPLPNTTFCGINYGHSNWTKHLSQCLICTENWIIYKNNKITENLFNWTKKCECGCGKISPYGRKFIRGHSRNHLTEDFIKNRREQFILHNPMNLESSKVAISKFWTGRKRPYSVGENNCSKRPEIKAKISNNNSMKNKDFRKKQQQGCSTKEERKRRSYFMKKNNPSKNKDILIKRTNTYTDRLSRGFYKIKNNWITGYYTKSDGTKEWYDSSYELKRMKYYDGQNIQWTKKHGIRIPYINLSGMSTFYVPDFKIIENDQIIIDEIKGWINEKVALKATAAIEYCKKIGFKYRVYVGKDLKLNESLSFI